MNKMKLETPYAIFVGDVAAPAFAKTGFGVVQWRPELCVGQVRLPECKVDLGLPDLRIDDLAGTAASLIIGVAPHGGRIPQHWLALLVAAASAGIDIVAGLHDKLADNPELAQAARGSGAKLIDVRVPPPRLPVGTGRKRTGKRLLTVGTDCAVGKKYTALALEREIRDRGISADYRATGQTGIMIAGEGIPIDAVVGDFISGAAELLSPDNQPEHWDVIEGQGSLLHPSYAAVSLGLLHGSQPDAIVVCHDATRTRLLGHDNFAVPGLVETIEANRRMALLVNPCVECVGVSVNTSDLHPDERQSKMAFWESETGVPCIDPLIDGIGPIVDRLMKVEIS